MTYTCAVQLIPASAALGGLESDYGCAVLHLAWATNPLSWEETLLCAAVELLPTEIPPPILQLRETVISKRFVIHLREVRVSVPRALSWFKRAARGEVTRANDDGSLSEDGDSAAPQLVAGPFAQEPPEGGLMTASLRVPFSPDWHQSVRVRHLITDSDPMATWLDAERKAVVEWLASDAHVDFDLFPEYTGSVHLLAPNPVFRSFSAVPRRSDDGRCVLDIAFVPRVGRAAAGLQVLVEEKRESGVGFIRCATVEENTARFELPYFPAEIRERVVDPTRGLLHDGHFGLFGVGFNMVVELASTVRHVEPGGGAQPYDVNLVGGRRSVSHIPPVVDVSQALGRLHRGSAERARRERGASQQKWFRDQAPDAVEALRSLVGGAKGEVFICDPYFEAGDLMKVVLAIADPSTVVRVLGSGKRMKAGNSVVANDLEKALATAAMAPLSNATEVRAMPGTSPPVHDRFILVGDALWMLGSSLNHFGERGTLMVRVPDPVPVLADLEAIWADSAPFADWLRAHRKAATR